MDQKTLETIEKTVMDLQSDSVDIRKPAENLMQMSLESNPTLLICGLMEVSHRSKLIPARSMSILLLRRYLLMGNAELYEKLEEKLKSQLKNLSLEIFENEQDKMVRRNVISLISDIAQVEMPKNNWAELLPRLETSSKSNNVIIRGDAFFLFGNVAGNNIDDNIVQRFKAVFEIGLGDPEMTVRIKSFDALVAFSEYLVNDENCGKLVLAILKLLEDSLKTSEDIQNELFEALIDLLTIAPKMIKHQFEPFIKILSGVAMSKNFSPALRMFALEALTVLAEEDNGLYRRSVDFVRLCYMSAMALMCELQDDDDWIYNIEDDEENDEMYTEGEMAMDRLSQSFGSERVIAVAMPLVLELLQSEEWVKRVVGLMSISQMSESIDISHVPKFVDLVTKYLSDNNPRVKFAAIHCIGQMCDDFAPNIQDQFHAVILPPLVNILSNRGFVKIQAHAGAALVNFIENASPRTLRPYIEKLFVDLFELLKNSDRPVQEQIVTIIACGASSVPAESHRVLESFVPVLYNAHVTCRTKKDTMFKAKCLEALTFIGTELKKEKFGEHAHQIMKTTITELDAFKKLNVDYLDFVLQSWIRLAKILKEDFAMYLPAVMPIIFKTCNEEGTMGTHEVHSNSDESYDEDYNPENSGINELESAVCSLTVIPSATGIHFFPYIKQAVDVADEYSSYFAEENVRVYSICSYPGLMHVACEAMKRNQIQFSNCVQCLENFVIKLLENYLEETDYEVKKTILISVIEVLLLDQKVSKTFLLNNGNDQKILDHILSVIEKGKVKDGKIAEKILKPENDQEEIKRYEMIRGLETGLLFKLTEILSVVMKVLNTDFQKSFAACLEKIILFLSSNDQNPYMKKAACLIVVDTIQHIPSLIPKYADYLCLLFVNLLEFDDIHVKQSCIYGLGLLSEKFNAAFSKKAEEVLNICVKMHGILKNSTDETHVTLRDNAISTCGRVIFSCAQQIDLKKSFPIWLSMLPCYSDEVEIAHCNELLFRVLESENNHCLGENLEHIPGILNALAWHLARSSFSESQKGSMARLLSKIKTLPSDRQNALAKDMTEEAKKMIMDFKVE